VGISKNFLISSLLTAASFIILTYSSLPSYIYIFLVFGVDISRKLMEDPPPRLRVEVVQGRNVFPSILCEVCNHLPTMH
jgi:hypothetical protein